MDPRETVRIAARSIAAHRLRSTLTVVGLVIGIASVIVFTTFGASVQQEVVSQVGGTNANNVYVLPSGDDGGPPDAVTAGTPAFTERDVNAIRDLEGVRAVIPQGIVATTEIGYRNQSIARRQMTATTRATFRNDSIVEGRAFRSGANETVLNEAAAGAFDGNVSVGDTITVRLASGERRDLTVVGVVSGTRGGFASGFGDAVPRFYVPVDPFYTTTVESPTLGVDQRAYPALTVVPDPAEATAVKERTSEYLRTDSDARQLLPAGTEISVQTSGDIVEEIEEVIQRITRFVTGIAVISLVVGAIGIANIMLVSVTERTKEIGIMKAVGATERDTVQLFLTEAVFLGALGAVVGVPLGLAVAYGATVYADVGFSVAYEWVAIAVVTGIGVGVVAGIYPAWQAANVDPIDALRYE